MTEDQKLALTNAYLIADNGLLWPEHSDFKRTYTALEKVFRILGQIIDKE